MADPVPGDADPGFMDGVDELHLRFFEMPGEVAGRHENLELRHEEVGIGLVQGFDGGGLHAVVWPAYARCGSRRGCRYAAKELLCRLPPRYRNGTPNENFRILQNYVCIRNDNAGLVMIGRATVSETVDVQS